MIRKADDAWEAHRRGPVWYADLQAALERRVQAVVEQFRKGEMKEKKK